MSECDERRIPGIKRVPVATLVEICGNQAGVPAFEAQSLDVSGRGMHVKTAYVPNVGDPLICRFENRGQEIVVEGVVAWRREAEDGGDFGIEFTALDSSSVDALRALCGVGGPAELDPDQAAGGPGAAQLEQRVCPSGTRVRLHIEGLGAPMKANVREGSTRRLHVGSQLEFLQVGRQLEIEDVGMGARRCARIDSVDVRVDPRTQIPELVVALRYSGVEDVTPEPSVVDQSGAEPSPYPAQSAERHTIATAEAGAADLDEQQAREVEAEMLVEQQAAEQARLVYDRLSHAAEGAAKLAKATHQGLSRFGHAATLNAVNLLKGASKQLSDLKARDAGAGRKRQTAPPPGGAVSFQGAKLRPQGAGAGMRAQGAPPAAPSQPAGRAAGKRRSAKFTIAAGGMLMLGATAAYGLRDVDGGPEPTAPVPTLAKPAAHVPPASAPAPSAAPPAAETGKIVANVPLFGPTPMATMEPVPLGPAPSPSEVEAREKAAAAASVEDLGWEEAGDGGADPSDVKPWGRGSMHLPTIHKLRLDAPGGALSGSVNATGFTVVIPGRKVMESGRAIQRRDKRIVKVQTSNTATGAQVTFQFRDSVPAYRVRLRKDSAEFLISAPQR